jgi:hypothetical protein
MGYTLRIGEACIEYDEDSVNIGCEVARRDGAPAFGEPTDHTSQRWPSYIQWSDAMKALGLEMCMFRRLCGGVLNEDFEWNGVSRYPLIYDHPGAQPITKEHVEYVEAKLAAYKAAHPTHIAQFPPLKASAKPLVPGTDFYAPDQYENDPKYDGDLCRGEWLAYWLRWALENCRRPVFVNS